MFVNLAARLVLMLLLLLPPLVGVGCWQDGAVRAVSKAKAVLSSPLGKRTRVVCEWEVGSSFVFFGSCGGTEMNRFGDSLEAVGLHKYIIETHRTGKSALQVSARDDEQVLKQSRGRFKQRKFVAKTLSYFFFLA